MLSEAIKHTDRAPRRPLRDPSPILNWPLDKVLDRQFSMQLQYLMKIYTVAHLLGAWQSPRRQKQIEDVFDTPDQAHHAVATCAAWLGLAQIAAPGPVDPWWAADEHAAAN